MKTLAVSLTVLLLLVTASSLRQGVNIHQRTIGGLSGKLVKAFGNYEQGHSSLERHIWQKTNPWMTITNMMKHYQLTQGPTYNLEYYRDSSLNTVAYILYQQSGAQIKKFYGLRVQQGHLAFQFFYLGNENTFGVRPGHQMPLLNYTHQNIGSDPALINSLLTQISTHTQIVYSPSSITEYKFWVFPKGKLMLLQCKNSNLSSTYFTLLRYEDSVKYISHTLVPRHVISKQYDNVYIDTAVKLYMLSVFACTSIWQKTLPDIEFFEIMFDPLDPRAMYIMLVLNNKYSLSKYKSKFVRSMGVIAPFNANPQIANYGLRRTLSLKDLVLDEFLYTQPNENPYHSKPYFQSVANKRIVQGVNIPVQKVMAHSYMMNSERSDKGLLRFYSVAFPNYKVYVIQSLMRGNFLIYSYFLWDQKTPTVAGVSIWSQYRVYSEVFNPNPLIKSDLTAAIARKQSYKDQYNIATGHVETYVPDLMNAEFCSLDGDKYQLAVYYKKKVRSWFTLQFMFKNKLTGQIYYLGQKDYSRYHFKRRPIKFSVCPKVKFVKLGAGEISSFYQSGNNLLVNPVNQALVESEIKEVVSVDLSQWGIPSVWVVDADKKGVKSQLIVTKDSKGEYELTDYRDDSPKMSPNDPQQTGPGGVPLIGGSPTFTLSGNGDLTQSLVSDLFPQLMNQVNKNAENSCTSINKIDYFVDPLNKMIAFMLSCPQASGFTVYEIVYLPYDTSYLYMGKKQLLTVPNPYWKLNAVEASSQLSQAISSEVQSSFKPGITLQTVMFDQQLQFINGVFDFVGFELNDGTKMQGQFLCSGDKCITLMVNVIQMGSGVPSDGSQPDQNGNGDNQDGGNNGQNQNGGNNGQNQDGNNENNDSTSTNNGSDKPDSSNSDSGSSNGGSFNYGGIFSPPNVDPNAISFQTLSPQQVQKDAYLIPIYQALLPSLPSDLTSLSIEKIKKGIFINGTISYQIYYESNSATETIYLTILFEPTQKKVIHLYLEKIQKKPSYSSYFPSQPSSSTTSSSTSGGYSQGGSCNANQMMLRQIFTSWVVNKHSQLIGVQPSSFEMTINGNMAICTMVYLCPCGKAFRVQLQMDTYSTKVTELAYSQLR